MAYFLSREGVTMNSKERSKAAGRHWGSGAFHSADTGSPHTVLFLVSFKTQM